MSYHQQTGIDDYDIRRGCVGMCYPGAGTMKIPYRATSSAPKGDRLILEYTTKWSSRRPLAAVYSGLDIPLLHLARSP